MKKFLFPLFILITTAGFAQTNNSWIDYNKTYYKFNVGSTGLYRVNQGSLPAALANVPAEQFQLWRNGQQVRLYTSASTGALPAGGFIEFWGMMNDGKMDTKLYKVADHQLSDAYSLETDTSAYFLTVNPAGGNLRFTNAANNVAGTPLPADAYFMNKIGVNYRNKINAGYAAVVGFYVYSSSYDIGEGWSSNDIAPGPGYALSAVLQNINLYPTGPAATLKLNAVGNALNGRNIKVKFFNEVVLDEPMNYFGYLKKTVNNIPISTFLSPDFLTVAIENTSPIPNDLMVVSSFEVTYPSKWNFNNQKNFSFELPASATGNHIIIDNFNYGTVAPVLLDMKTGSRYTGDISTAGKVKFLLPASTDPSRQFILVNQESSNISSINTFRQRNFINYNLAANQSNYMIISHSSLYNNGSGINYVDQYKNYRSTLAGGGFNAKMYDIDQLTDQFAFGIKQHPAAIKDFIQNVKANFTAVPKFLFIIGKGVSYDEFRPNESKPAAEKLSLVPTFGYPASDVSLTTNYDSYIPDVPVGRLSAVKGDEVKIYLDKVKQYEDAQRSQVQTVAEKAWMKNVIHVAGGADSAEGALFKNYLKSYEDVIEDTFYGGKVETFLKSNTAAVQIISGKRIEELINEGTSFLQYFGHSSANSLAFNLSDPEIYNNAGKYPFFNVSGCTAGNIFSYDSTRLTGIFPSISERWVLAPQRGSIAFMASTHLGIPPFLNNYNYNLYRKISYDNYGEASGVQVKRVIEGLAPNGFPVDYFTRMHIEEINLHGDPAIKINAAPKPDYAIEEPMIRITPGIVSVADNSFKIDVNMINLGKAIGDSIRVLVQRKLPNDTLITLFNQRIPAIRYRDSLQFVQTINPVTDKGLNKIIVTLDTELKVDEMSETNNTVTKDVYIFEDEVRPVYPYNFAIVSQQNVSYFASTANPLTGSRQIVLEVDTTELFNSPFKKITNINSIGGLIQFTPSINYTDSTVYYWRVGMTPTTGSMIWNSSSFVYIANSSKGFNQSHYYQHLRSTTENITYDRVWRFTTQPVEVGISTGNFPPNGVDKTFVRAGPVTVSTFGIRFGTLQFVALDPRTLEGLQNRNLDGVNGLNKSNSPLNTSRQWQFEYYFNNLENRNKAMTILDSVPNGHYVILYNFLNNGATHSYVNDWKGDASQNPGGVSLYTRLKSLGFNKLDSFTRNVPMLFIYKKGDPSFTPIEEIGILPGDVLQKILFLPQSTTNGSITSPWFGPAKSWKSLHWRGTNVEPATPDQTSIEVYGLNSAGATVKLATVNPARDTTLAFIDASMYRYLQLKLLTQDKVNATPYQLRYWMINADYIPEGAIAPNIAFTMKDTVEQGEKINFSIAFKNVSEVNFDSLKIKVAIRDVNNVERLLPVTRRKPLVSGDTLMIGYSIDTRDISGMNTLFVEVNPDNDQLEQFHFNNFIYKSFFVKPDNYNPLLDVTFDGVHILNRDIVSARPHIVIKLKDESKYLALSDTSLLKVSIKYPGPGGITRVFRFDNDTMKFTPANLANGDNTATIDLSPTLPGSDEDYELTVTGKDVMGNTAGNLAYRVAFRVISKPMISNLLNYPNPFTSSTAFVFTITGTDVPQNIRIQILTVTGKIVREITKAELGPLHIGRNITDFKWDGTDMYGSKLANGVYLYRVLTNHNGKSLDKFKDKDDDSDKYFTKGYGKMYLMR